MRLLKWTLCATLLAEIALCPRLWLATRAFPTVPAFSGLPELPASVTFALTGLFIAGILAVAALPEPKWALVIVIGTGSLLTMFDVDRLQPWLYQGLLMFLALTRMRWKEPDSRESREAWAGCAFIFAATYFWSGLHKANGMFASSVFPWLLHPLGLDRFSGLWFVAPILETATGICLFIPRTRLFGQICLAGMHAFLLLALGPAGGNQNSVVWPWNIGMIAMAFVIFFRKRSEVFEDASRSAAGKVTLCLIGVMPAFNFAGLWDEYLSMSLYSGKAQQGFILLTEEGARRLPANVQPFLERRSDRIGLDITRWSLADLNVPPYPQVRVYQDVAKRLEAAGVPSGDLKLLVTERPGILESQSKFAFVPVPGL